VEKTADVTRQVHKFHLHITLTQIVQSAYMVFCSTIMAASQRTNMGFKPTDQHGNNKNQYHKPQ
jgi:Na+(H+)/acetate symporter ActP